MNVVTLTSMRTFFQFLSHADENIIFGKNLTICNFLGAKEVQVTLRHLNFLIDVSNNRIIENYLEKLHIIISILE